MILKKHYIFFPGLMKDVVPLRQNMPVMSICTWKITVPYFWQCFQFGISQLVHLLVFLR